MSDVGTPFKEEALNKREHNDPDIHWIGESLPVASVDEITFAGTETSTGHSRFPAAADHSHDIHTRFTLINTSSAKAVGAGAAVVINTLQNIGGEDWFTGTGSIANQRMAFPQEGLYLIQLRLAVARSTATFVGTDRYVATFKYTNGGATKIIYTGSANEGGTTHQIGLIDLISKSTTTDFNLELEITNNCAVSVNVTLNASYLVRLASAFGVSE